MKIIIFLCTLVPDSKISNSSGTIYFLLLCITHKFSDVYLLE